MKKFLDLVLILLVIGTPIFLFVVLPDREERGAKAPRPPIDLDLPEAPESSDPAPTVVVEPPPSIVETVDPTRVPPPAARGSLVLDGYFFRGGSSPLAGFVPIQFEGVEAPVADRDGTFRLELTEGLLGLETEPGEEGPRAAVQVPAVNGVGRLSVHRYFEGEPGELITPAAALLLQSESLDEPRLLVQGRSLLPDGADIAVRLFAAGVQLEATLLRVASGHFSGEVPLSDRDFHAGAYQLQFAWGPELATSRVRVAMAESPWSDLPGEIHRDLAVFFGTVAEERAQRLEIVEFYRVALDELEGTRDFMLVVGAEARRKRNKLLDNPDRVERMRRAAIARTHSDLFSKRKLQVPAWRSLIDAKVPEVVRPYIDIDSIPYVARYPKAAHHLSGLTLLITKHAKLESRLVYDALGLDPHPGNYVADFDFPPAVEKRQVLRKIRIFLETIREELALEED